MRVKWRLISVRRKYPAGLVLDSMPRRRLGYNLSQVLLALIIRRGSVQVRVLRRLFGRGVYAYLERLEESGVVVVRDGIASVNTSFNDLINTYIRDIEKAIKAK